MIQERSLSVALKTPVIALMPDDNQQCWNFYDDSDNHFRFKKESENSGRENSFLGSISVETVFNKVREILKR